MKLFATCLFLVPLLINFGLIQSQMPPQQIIIHFDINKTMIAEDLAGQKEVEGILNAALADQTKSVWSDQLSGPISYTQYVEDYLLKGQKADRDLKKKRYHKTCHFLDYLKTTHHECLDEVSKKYDKLLAIVKSHKQLWIGENGQATEKKCLIFPSCYKLIKQLRDGNKKHAIVLRTFGNDLDIVMQELNSVFPDFFGWKGVFKNNILTLNSVRSQEKCTIDLLKEPQEFYQFLKNKEGHFALQDDFDRWHDGGEVAQFGKLFPIDPADESVVTLFADDNGDDGILNPRHIKTNESFNVKSLIGSRHILVADMIKAIEDEDYYVDHLHKLINQKK